MTTGGLRQEMVRSTGNEIAVGAILMRKFRSLLHTRIAWTIGGALAGISIPVLVSLAFKALALLHGGALHGGSLHTWLLDVGHHVKLLGALGGVGAGAGAGGAPTPQKDPDPNPCAGEERAVDADKGTIAALSDQLASKEAQIAALSGPINSLAAQASALWPQARSEVAQQAALTALTKLIQVVAEMSGPVGEGAAAVSAAVGIVSDPAGSVVSAADSQSVIENANFFTEMYQSFQACQGDVSALTELASANPMPAVSQFLGVVKEMNQMIDSGYAYLNQINNPNNGILAQLQSAQNKLKQDQQDLADCQKSNSGNGSSGGGDAGADA